MEVRGKIMQEAYNEHKISDRLQRAHNDYRPCQYLVTEVRPELIICYLELKFNTYDNSEPYYFDADSVMHLVPCVHTRPRSYLLVRIARRVRVHTLEIGDCIYYPSYALWQYLSLSRRRDLEGLGTQQLLVSLSGFVLGLGLGLGLRFRSTTVTLN